MSAILPNLHQCGIDELAGVVAQVRPALIVNLAGLDDWRPGEETQARRAGLYVAWPISDDQHLPPNPPLDQIVGLVADVVREGLQVVVHCAAGANRSGLICALAYRQVNRVDGKEALRAVLRARPTAFSNPHFEKYVRSLPRP